MLTDDEKERFAIQVEHLPPDEAQAEYDRLIAEAEKANQQYERNKSDVRCD